jgi:hypothetical protein
VTNARPARSWTAVTLCAGLLTLFAIVSWSAIDAKGATYDEPYHALSAWLQLRYADFRMDCEDPPLWQYWASLPNAKSALTADFRSSVWTTMPREIANQWYWGVTTLYRTAGNDPEAFIHRCRVMMLLLAIVLGICIARWAWQIGGPVAAVAATVVFAMDPNFIAHSSLMKNDVVFSLSMFLLAGALWQAGKQLTVWRILQIALLCIMTLTVKFSGLVAVMLVPLLLGLRAILPQPWMVFGKQMQSRSSRLAVAGGVVIVVAIISYAGIWAVYGFRFRPTPEPGVWLNMTDLANHAIQNRIIANGGVASPPGWVVRSVLFANQHGLLPQPFLAGFLFTYANAEAHPAFAAGQISMVGWWWYFPFAMLVKTPIATMLAAIVAWIVVLRSSMFFRVDSRPMESTIPSFGRRLKSAIPFWNAICLALPFTAFLASAMQSNFNIGIRHILPIYPFAFVAIGWAVSRIWTTGKRVAQGIVLALAAMLALESLSAYPDFIAFFNVVASNVNGGKISLLGDSNLDWGQDLPLLAAWQRANPKIPLYLSYFGYEDPAFYRIRYLPLPGGYYYDPTPRKMPDLFEPSVLAISATNLQGTLEPDRLRPYYRQWGKLKLRAVLGGTIYLFDNDPGLNLRSR